MMRNQSIEERYIAKFPKSKALYEEAKSLFPRGVTHDSRYILPFPIYVTHAKGSHKWDVDGYEYIDYFGGHGAHILGHGHPALVNAVKEQMEKGTQWAACHEMEIEWGNLIKRFFPSAELIEFTSSGTEAGMMGIRLARAFTGRSKVVRFEGQFGGWYDSMVGGAGGQTTVGGILADIAQNTLVIPANDERALERALSNRDVALLVNEGVGAFGGVIGIAPSSYSVMRELTLKYGTLFMLDEVVTGFRYPGGLQQTKEINPDLTMLGKILTGGVPGAGAIVGRADILSLISFKDDEWNRSKRISHPGTFNGNPLCAAAGIAVLKVLVTGEPQRKATNMATLLRKGFERVLKARNVDGCAYNEFSVVHLYFGSCEMRSQCNRKICLNSAKVRSTRIGNALNINLTLNGVHNMARGYEFLLSSVHSEKDIDDTIKVFDLSIKAMIVSRKEN